MFLGPAKLLPPVAHAARILFMEHKNHQLQSRTEDNTIEVKLQY